MNKILYAAVLVIALMFLFTAYFYPIMPEKMAIHWSLDNQPNGYGSKAFFFPLFLGFTVLVFLLFIFLPKIDPMKMKYAEFQKEYDLLVLLFTGFMLYLFLAVIVSNLGFALNMGFLVVLAMAVLFYFIGKLLEKVKRNWFVGIRTPWTMSSDAVWDKTHKLAAKIFKALAILMIGTGILSSFFSNYFFIIVIAEIIILVTVPVVFSYLEFQKEHSKRHSHRPKWKKHSK